MLISSSSISFGLITSGARWLQGWTCQQLLWGRIHSETPNSSMNNSWKINSEVAVHNVQGRAESYSAEKWRKLWIRCTLIDVSTPPQHTLLPPTWTPLNSLPQITAPRLQLCCRAASHYSGVYFSCPSCVGIWQFSYTVGWLMMSTWKRQYHQQPIFFKMFSSLFLKILSEHFKREVTLKGITCLAPPPAGWLTVSGTSNRRVSRPAALSYLLAETTSRFPSSPSGPITSNSPEWWSVFRDKTHPTLGEVSVLSSESFAWNTPQSPLSARVRVFSLQGILWCSNVKCHATSNPMPQ